MQNIFTWIILSLFGKKYRYRVVAGKLAKRYPCSSCDKRFRTRDQCREHLFAVHRRGEMTVMTTMLNAPMMQTESPTKQRLYETVAQENKAVVSSVVESLHQQLEQARRASAEHEHTVRSLVRLAGGRWWQLVR